MPLYVTNGSVMPLALAGIVIPLAANELRVVRSKSLPASVRGSAATKAMAVATALAACSFLFQASVATGCVSYGSVMGSLSLQTPAYIAITMGAAARSCAWLQALVAVLLVLATITLGTARTPGHEPGPTCGSHASHSKSTRSAQGDCRAAAHDSDDSLLELSASSSSLRWQPECVALRDSDPELAGSSDSELKGSCTYTRTPQSPGRLVPEQPLQAASVGAPAEAAPTESLCCPAVPVGPTGTRRFHGLLWLAAGVVLLATIITFALRLDRFPGSGIGSHLQSEQFLSVACLPCRNCTEAPPQTLSLPRPTGTGCVADVRLFQSTCAAAASGGEATARERRWCEAPHTWQPVPQSPVFVVATLCLAMLIFAATLAGCLLLKWHSGRQATRHGDTSDARTGGAPSDPLLPAGNPVSGADARMRNRDPHRRRPARAHAAAVRSSRRCQCTGFLERAAALARRERASYRGLVLGKSTLWLLKVNVLYSSFLSHDTYFTDLVTALGFACVGVQLLVKITYLASMCRSPRVFRRVFSWPRTAIGVSLVIALLGDGLACWALVTAKQIGAQHTTELWSGCLSVEQATNSSIVSVPAQLDRGSTHPANPGVFMMFVLATVAAQWHGNEMARLSECLWALHRHEAAADGGATSSPQAAGAMATQAGKCKAQAADSEP